MIWLLLIFAALAAAGGFLFTPRSPTAWLPESRELLVERLARVYHAEGEEWPHAYALAVLAVDVLELDEAEL